MISYRLAEAFEVKFNEIESSRKEQEYQDIDTIDRVTGNIVNAIIHAMNIIIPQVKVNERFKSGFNEDCKNVCAET